MVTIPLRSGQWHRVRCPKPCELGFVAENAAALMEWSLQTPYRRLEDWAFASPKMHGKQPYWPETLLKCYVRPAAKRLGITKQIGWHSFRRTFATLLKGSGEDVKRFKNSCVTRTAD